MHLIVNNRNWNILCIEMFALLIVLAGCGNSSLPAQPPSIDTTPLTLSPSATTSPIPTTSSTDWITYHRDNTRTGYLASISDPQSLSRVWDTHLDGAVYAEPLVIGGRVLVATEGNSVYSLDASSGQVQWHTTVGTPFRSHNFLAGISIRWGLRVHLFMTLELVWSSLLPK